KSVLFNFTCDNPEIFRQEIDEIEDKAKKNNLKIANIYGDIVTKTCDEDLCTTGCDRTGCVFCGFGLHLERGENRFQRLK
ncbi:MAG: hypothetical protein K2K06_06210, partial [Oscillospiraceae bacterium]|nr:hypothetical protein [Oscillospiraceae bacterium]